MKNSKILYSIFAFVIICVVIIGHQDSITKQGQTKTPVTLKLKTSPVVRFSNGSVLQTRKIQAEGRDCILAWIRVDAIALSCDWTTK